MPDTEDTLEALGVVGGVDDVTVLDACCALDPLRVAVLELAPDR